MKPIPILLLALLLTACESSEETALKEFVASQFKDPQSTQFQKITYKDNVMCGEVNSKNGYGAYVGFKRFVAKKQLTEFTGAVEEIGNIGKQNPIQNIVLNLSAINILKAVQINIIRASAGLPPKDFSNDEAKNIVAKYPEQLQIYKAKITKTISENELSELADEMVKPIEFWEAYKAACQAS